MKIFWQIFQNIFLLRFKKIIKTNYTFFFFQISIGNNTKQGMLAGMCRVTIKIKNKK